MPHWHMKTRVSLCSIRYFFLTFLVILTFFVLWFLNIFFFPSSHIYTHFYMYLPIFFKCNVKILPHGQSNEVLLRKGQFDIENVPDGRARSCRAPVQLSWLMEQTQASWAPLLSDITWAQPVHRVCRPFVFLQPARWCLIFKGALIIHKSVCLKIPFRNARVVLQMWDGRPEDLQSISSVFTFKSLKWQHLNLKHNCVGMSSTQVLYWWRAWYGCFTWIK